MLRLGLLVALGAATSVVAESTEVEQGTAPVTNMGVGSFHTAVIIKYGMVNVVKNWGANGKGQLGLNDTKDRGDNDGGVGDDLPKVALGSNLHAVEITAGLRHTAAIMDDGTVRSWGYNGKGQLGVGNVTNVGDEADQMGDNMAVTLLGSDGTPESIVAGGWHTCTVMTDQRLKCWGYNQWGELGLEDKNDRGDEPDEMGDNLEFVDLGDDVVVKSIALGDWHTCALVNDGDVKCFGKNLAGQLGLEDTNHRGDESGEMGDDLDMVNLGGKKATAITCGEEHTCAILDDGDLVCWGLGDSGQLGQGNRLSIGDVAGDMYNLVGINLGVGRTVVEVAAGGNHTCALLDNDDVKCWGENSYGQLGMGDTFNRGVASVQMGDNLYPVQVGNGWKLHSLDAGYTHTCALVDQLDLAGMVLCWGGNFNGQVGLGISETENIGDEPDEMGDNLRLVNLGGEFGANGDDEWYKETWFYIVCGVVGAVLICCLCLVCMKCRRRNSGRGPRKSVSYVPSPVPSSKETTDDDPPAPAANVATPPTPVDVPVEQV